MKTYRLSKSKVVLGIQCEKALYLKIKEPHLAPEVSESQQMIFDQGHEVGIFAQKLFPGGILVEAPYNKTKLALDETRTSIEAGVLHIFEATFEHQDLLVKVDVLTRESVKSAWEIVEVKSSTGLKDVHVLDAAIQLWVLRGSGIKIKSVTIMHIDNECVFPKLDNLLKRVDVTEEVEKLQKDIPKIVEKFHKTIAAKKAPSIDIGPHCDDPYECAFKEHCWSKKKIPDISTFDIPRLATKKKWEFYSRGKVGLDSIDPEDFNKTQKRMIEVTLSKKGFIDKASIKAEIQKWKFPLSFLDFETIGYAIPRYNGTRPYQQLPFQFSCHIQKDSNQKVEHLEYLHEEDTDPRLELAKALTKSIPDKGNVVAYNMGFEKGVLLNLADQFPKYSKALKSIAERLVDPLNIFRDHVYDPAFAGSFSIKAVAPAILGKDASYDDMPVAGGIEAQVAFKELIDSNTSESRKTELKAALFKYCKKDTLSMVQLVWWLMEQAEK